MSRETIAPEKLVTRSTSIWAEQWMLLTAGDFAASEFNTMTVAWGSIGTMWQRPFVQAVVRPTRYTYEFMEKYPTFTLSVFPKSCRPALQLLGTVSGRDRDKIADSGLTPIASKCVAAPAFEEAELILECKKIFADDMRPEAILDPSVHDLYSENDYHRIYFGQILDAQGTFKYAAQDLI